MTMAKESRQLARAARSGGERFQLVWAVDQNLVSVNESAHAGDKNKTLNEGITLKLPEYGYFKSSYKLSITATNPFDNDQFKLEEPLLFNKYPVSYLVLEAEIYPEDRNLILEECEEFWNRDDYKESAIQYAAYNLIHNTAKNVIICANIAKPGSITSRRGYVSVGDKNFPIQSFNSSIFRGLALEERKSLRLFRDLPFVDVWNWYSGIKGTIAGVPTSDTEAAVCNFISLFDENSDLSGARDLIWSFAGLEALLAESESGVVSQLRQKLIAIFGNQVDIKDFDKQIREMYQTRSNIVHGKTRDIPTFQGHFMQKGKTYNRQNQNEAADFAMYILTSLIQYCCQNSLSQIKFKTVVV